MATYSFFRPHSSVLEDAATSSTSASNLWRNLPVARRLRTLYSGMLDLVYPVSCPGCETRLLDVQFPVCTSCLPLLERVPQHTAKQALTRLQQSKDTFHFVLSLWAFDKAGTVQRIHRALKYNNKPAIGRQLGVLMAHLLLAPLPLDQHPTLVIPVPLHRKRFLERGYNQSRQLATGLANAAHLHLASTLLTRNRYTATQTGHDARARLKNVHDAFSIPPELTPYVRDHHVLLVDDVLTTGATLLAAAAPLREAGATQISVATLAFARL